MTTGSVPRRRVPVVEGHAALLAWARAHEEDPAAAAALPRPTRATAVRFALEISPDVVAVHLLDLGGEDDEGEAARLRGAWQRDVATPARAAGLRPPRLMLLPATYRRIHAPLLRLPAVVWPDG